MSFTALLELYEDGEQVWHKTVEFPSRPEGPLLVSATRDLTIAYLREREQAKEPSE